jgi:hypothetical protein
MEVPIKDPAPSTQRYEQSSTLAASKLFFSKQSPKASIGTLSGRVLVRLTYKGQPFDPLNWFADNIVKELIARGVPVQLSADANAATNVVIKRIDIENHVIIVGSPFETYASLRADVLTEKGMEPVAAFVKRGKFPKWSEEVLGPTYNESLTILAKELAAKLNQRVYGLSVSDSIVDELAAKTSKKTKDMSIDSLDVYQLGFSNNLRSVPVLVNLTDDPDDEVRFAAISSLGILRAINQFELLTKIYESKKAKWEDRAAALKSIGDMGTQVALAYLKAQSAKLKENVDDGSRLIENVIALYTTDDDAVDSGVPCAEAADYGQRAAAAEGALRTALRRVADQKAQQCKERVCAEATEYSKRAAAAEGAARASLQRIADHKMQECKDRT